MPQTRLSLLKRNFVWIFMYNVVILCGIKKANVMVSKVIFCTLSLQDRTSLDGRTCLQGRISLDSRMAGLYGAKDFPEQDLTEWQDFTGWQAFAGGHG